MKKLVVAAFAVIAAGGAFAAAVDAMTQDVSVVVTSLSVRQRYPWNGKVDIDFSLYSTIPEAFAFVRFAATCVNKSGETVDVPMRTFDHGASWFCASSGTYRVTWDSTADAPTLMATGLTYTATATMAKYMVVDLSKGTSATADDPYPITYMEECPDPTRQDGGWTDEYRKTKMVFRLVQPGTAKLGWSINAFTDWNCTPVRTVTFTRPFYLAIFECTQGQAKQINGSYISNSTYEFTKGPYRDVRPVCAAAYNVWRGKGADGCCWPNHGSAVDPSSVIGLLRTRTGNNNGFDMPTESEWEYAARSGGIDTDAWGGDGLTTSQTGTTAPGPTSYYTNTVLTAKARYKFNDGYIANADGSVSSPGYGYEGVDHGTAIVGSYKPNAWGFYDMLGNVRECALDYYSGGRSAETVDPVGKLVPATVVNTNEVVRTVKGGHWDQAAQNCSLPFRNGSDAHKASYTIQGCRIAWRFPTPPQAQ